MEENRQINFNQIFFSRSSISRSFEYFFSQNNSREKTIRNLTDEDSFFTFIYNSKHFFSLIFKALKEGTFELMPAREIKIIADKERTIYKFSWPDRFLLTHLALCIEHITGNKLSESVHSFRKGRSQFTAIEQAKSYIESHPGEIYVLRRDISKFGESLEHNLLIEDFQRWLNPSNDILQLFIQICSFPIEKQDKTIEINKKGLPTGSHLQLVMENLFLDSLDRSLENIADSKYIRYGDDILFLTSDRQVFHKIKSLIDKEICARGLEFNAEKTLDICLCPTHKLKIVDDNAVERKPFFQYLGVRLWQNSSQTLTPEKQRSVQSFIRTRLSRVCSIGGPSFSAEKKIEIMISTLKELLSKKAFLRTNPIREYLIKANNEAEFKSLDLWVAQLILKLAYKKGFSKKNFRRMPFWKLRQLGLPSLLDMRRKNEI